MSQRVRQDLATEQQKLHCDNIFSLTQYIQDIVSTCNQYKNELDILYSLSLCKILCAFYTYIKCQFRLATFQVLNSYICLWLQYQSVTVTRKLQGELRVPFA